MGHLANTATVAQSRSADRGKATGSNQRTTAKLPRNSGRLGLAEMVDDTLTAVHSDAYLAGLTVYQSAKHAGKNSGLDGALDELGRRFVRKSGGTQPAAPAGR